ncbi:hypothetical protein RJT34_08425 [Clitoria ternatea]|uniref:Legumain prodomain domain-containing protein n=1 Tax=Clitoria ternatea TaxID=43366 RepID=A0AAN9PSS0_CLITE
MASPETFSDCPRNPTPIKTFVVRGGLSFSLVPMATGTTDIRQEQADICHAYQILRKGGLKEENIIVFMYDDIAFNENNPRPGVIINKPDGDDVYEGVPKDYTGEDVNVNNFFAVLLGNKSALTGGSGKVLNSGPDDHIFIFYADHGGPGVLGVHFPYYTLELNESSNNFSVGYDFLKVEFMVLGTFGTIGMPTHPYLYANDLNEVLKKKHASGTYKRLVFYIEACESGSIFEGLLPEDIDIYATTASNATESSSPTYCPRPPAKHAPLPEYTTCLGDLYSVTWMEDRYLKEKVSLRSNVMQYGDIHISSDVLFQYLGTNPTNENFTLVDENYLRSSSKLVNQRDADLIHFWHKFHKAPEGSAHKNTAQKQVLEVMSHRMHIDNSVQLIGKLLFGIKKGPETLNKVRPTGSVLVDDWGCLKTMVRTFETYYGSLSQYGMKHMRSFANIYNAGIKNEQMAEASTQACVSIPTNPWSSLQRGFSA